MNDDDNGSDGEWMDDGVDLREGDDETVRETHREIELRARRAAGAPLF